MKTLIVFYSFSRNNELLAKEIHARLGNKSDLFEIKTVRRTRGWSIFLDVMFQRTPKLKQLNHSVQQYDHYIFIAPIWAGKVASPLKSFLLSQKRFIKTYSFITICGGVKGQKEKLQSELTNMMNHRPQQVRELWMSRLLEEKGKDKRKVTGYRMAPQDLDFFREEVDEFLSEEIK
jgi:multimeric flavodoxin WrbA